MIGDFCVDCSKPATHERLVSFEAIDVIGDGEPFCEIIELVCEEHRD